VASIPAYRELWIVELPSVSDDTPPPPGKKTLIYPIGIRCSTINGLLDSGPAAPPPVAGDRSGDRSRRRFQRGSSVSRSRSQSPTAGGSTGQERVADNSDGTDQCMIGWTWWRAALATLFKVPALVPKRWLGVRTSTQALGYWEAVQPPPRRS
jgi:hypothetical protein